MQRQRIVLGGHDLRAARDLQCALTNRAGKALTQHPVEHLGADLLAEALLDPTVEPGTRIAPRPRSAGAWSTA